MTDQRVSGAPQCGSGSSGFAVGGRGAFRNLAVKSPSLVVSFARSQITPGAASLASCCRGSGSGAVADVAYLVEEAVVGEGRGTGGLRWGSWSRSGRLPWCGTS